MLILYRIYFIIVAIPLLLVATIVTSLLTLLSCFVGLGRPVGYYLPRLWAKLFCWLTFVRVTVYGRENIKARTSYVFVANHQGAYDIFAVFGHLNHQFRWMMKKSLEKIPLVGLSCRLAGQIFVDNSSPSAIRSTMQAAEKQLSGGMSVVVFPEGSRTFTGKVGRFKRGAYTLAEEFDLPVVPITIDGAFKVLPRTSVLPRWGHIRLTIHPAITADAGGHDMAALMQRSRDAILSSLPASADALTDR